MTISTASQHSKPFLLPSGPVSIEAYQECIESPFFRSLESFSDSFIATCSEELSAYYETRWVRDSFHQWSRQWEYPFVASQVENLIKENPSASLLDAGCGMSFLPYYFLQKYTNLQMVVSDMDPELPELYQKTNTLLNTPVEFVLADMRNLPFEDSTFDAISCISVLEHTGSYPEIVKEFSRVLKPHGRLLLTFDISLDGKSDVDRKEAEHILSTLRNYFLVPKSAVIPKISEAESLITTPYMKTKNPGLLPWKYPTLSAMRSALQKKKLPFTRYKKLTFLCLSAEKADA